MKAGPLQEHTGFWGSDEVETPKQRLILVRRKPRVVRPCGHLRWTHETINCFRQFLFGRGERL